MAFVFLVFKVISHPKTDTEIDMYGRETLTTYYIGMSLVSNDSVVEWAFVIRLGFVCRTRTR